MKISTKLFLLAIAGVVIPSLAVHAFPARPAPDYTAASPYEESSWEFVIYEEDDSISSMGYNLSLWECLGMMDAAVGKGRACRRQEVMGSR